MSRLNFKSVLRITALLGWAAFIGWALVITYLSSLTPNDLQVIPSGILEFDKLVHALAFAVGANCLGFALRETSQLRGIWLFVAIVVGIGLFGAADELHQLFTPGRVGADFKDWVADMIGGSLAAFVYCRVYGRPSVDSHPARSDGADSPAS